MASIQFRELADDIGSHIKEVVKRQKKRVTKPKAYRLLGVALVKRRAVYVTDNPHQKSNPRQTFMNALGLAMDNLRFNHSDQDAIRAEMAQYTHSTAAKKRHHSLAQLKQYQQTK